MAIVRSCDFYGSFLAEMAEHIAYVPYAELIRHFREHGQWKCVSCGGVVVFLGFGHQPKPSVPLFECRSCGRRSDGCQAFEAHHLLYGGCALEDDKPVRCGHWLCEWARPRGTCPVCGATRQALTGVVQNAQAAG